MISWMKYECFQRGISPQVFKKAQMRDLLEIFEIKDAIDTKQIRQDEIERMLAEMRGY